MIAGTIALRHCFPMKSGGDADFTNNLNFNLPLTLKQIAKTLKQRVRVSVFDVVVFFSMNLTVLVHKLPKRYEDISASLTLCPSKQLKALTLCRKKVIRVPKTHPGISPFWLCVDLSSFVPIFSPPLPPQLPLHKFFPLSPSASPLSSLLPVIPPIWLPRLQMRPC